MQNVSQCSCRWQNARRLWRYDDIIVFTRKCWFHCPHYNNVTTRNGIVGFSHKKYSFRRPNTPLPRGQVRIAVKAMDGVCVCTTTTFNNWWRHPQHITVKEQVCRRVIEQLVLAVWSYCIPWEFFIVLTVYIIKSHSLRSDCADAALEKFEWLL